jgi:hypothetical protein
LPPSHGIDENHWPKATPAGRGASGSVILKNQGAMSRYCSYNKNRSTPCHPERSEGSAFLRSEKQIFRAAQDDMLTVVIPVDFMERIASPDKAISLFTCENSLGDKRPIRIFIPAAKRKELGEQRRRFARYAV